MRILLSTKTAQMILNTLKEIVCTCLCHEMKAKLFTLKRPSFVLNAFRFFREILCVGFTNTRNNLITKWAVVVAQLAEWSLQIPEAYSSNTVTGKVL